MFHFEKLYTKMHFGDFLKKKGFNRSEQVPAYED